jgi:tetratricopeptide (TPR) repeat protein
MNLRNILSTCIFFVMITNAAYAELSQEQICSLFSQANQYFRQANSAGNTEQADQNYHQAILSFEKIIEQGGIKNAKLYYNLANTYFLLGQTGKAILYYRKAANLENDNNIRKNLNFARSQRKDQVTMKTETRVLQTLFFWHYDFKVKTKFLMVSISWAILCISVTIMIWRGRKNTHCMAAAIIFGIAFIALISSVTIETRALAKDIGGVIIAKEVVAYQGDSRNYPPSFKEPLHEGTEFNLLESRSGWLHIKLFDDSEGWIPNDSAELV